MQSYSSIVGLFGEEGGRYIEVVEHRFHEVIRRLLKDVHVDEVWYRETYQDVEAAIIGGSLSSAREHYITAGYFEDRFPHWIVVDTAWYLQQNSDVAEGIRVGKIKSAEEHFRIAGFREGRLPSPGWSLLSVRY
ncbi:MAG TPA: hypothetical protein VHY35_14925 [Stellaceae bacterium]|jgi:hypothetical protein|nr:hypothetical protein [Stellaceae bacterium]